MKSGLKLIGKILGTILAILADTLRTFAASILVMLFCIPYSAFMSFRYCYQHRRYSPEQQQQRHSQTRAARANAAIRKKKHPRLMSQEDVDEKFPLQSYKAAKLIVDDKVEEKLEGKLEKVEENVEGPEESVVDVTAKAEVVEKLQAEEFASSSEKNIPPRRLSIIIGNEEVGKSLNSKDSNETIVTPLPSPPNSPHNPETLKCFEQGPDVESQCASISESSSDSDDMDDPLPLDIPDDTCAICIDCMNENEVVRRLTCGHIFHAECVDPWLTTRRAYCPLCKFDYYVAKPEDEEQQMNPPPPSSRRQHHNRRSSDLPRNNSTSELILSFFGFEPSRLNPTPSRNRHEASDRSQQRHDYYRQEFNRRNSNTQQRQQERDQRREERRERIEQREQEVYHQIHPIIPQPPAVAAR